MNIWVVKYGETVPFLRPERQDHYFRSGELVRRLAQRGHDVTWWTGRFEHQSKSHLGGPETIQVPNTSITIELLDSPGYRSNVSVRRFYDHWVIARSFQHRLRGRAAPDAIVASFPTPELAGVALFYARRNNVPLIVDVRDMWPDAITERIGERFGISLPPFLLHYNHLARRVLGTANSVVSISPPFLQWAQQRGGRTESQKQADRVFYLAATQRVVRPDRQAEIAERWRQRGLVIDKSRRIFCWAGSLTNQTTTRNLVDALCSLPPAVVSQVQIVVCGKGDLETRLADVARQYKHVLFTGFVERDDLQYLYDRADVGLLCYDNTKDFQASFPNKFGEYLMSGLTVLTSVKGLMTETFGQERFLVTSAGNSPSSLAQAIGVAATMDIPAEVKNGARTVFREHFDADVVYAHYMDHIEKLARAQA